MKQLIICCSHSASAAAIVLKMSLPAGAQTGKGHSQNCSGMPDTVSNWVFRNQLRNSNTLLHVITHFGESTHV